VPGLQEIGGPPALSSIAIRGLDAARVLVLVDGEPAPGAIMDSRDLGRLSTLGAERIEVTKGPGSVEFGSDALGGVINLVTTAPSASREVSAAMRTGALGRREGDVGASDTYGRVGVRVHGGWRQSDRVTAIQSDESTFERVYDLRADARVRLAGAASLRVDGSGSQQRQRWPVGGGFNGFIDTRQAHAITELVTPARGGMLRVRGFAQAFAYQFRQSRGALPIAGSGDSLQQDERFARGMVSYARSFGAHAVDVGALVSSRSLTAPGRVTGGTASDVVTEAFLRDAWRRNAVLFSAGARATSSSLWGAALTPSLGVVWQPREAWHVRSTVARGFRGPSFKELRYTFLNAAGGYEIVGNATLQPERAWTTSAAVAYAPARAVRLEVEAYHNALDNLIALRSIGLNAAGLQRFENVNVARARTQGVEIGVRWTHRATELSAGYDLLDARDLETGRMLDGRARHTARATASLRASQLGGTVADLSVRHTGRATLGSRTQGGFTSMDTQVRVGTAQRVELSVGVVNALDQRPVGWTPAFQRQWLLGVRVHTGGARGE
jgi:outer membrane receptor for ferrienterochelin and colicins